MFLYLCVWLIHKVFFCNFFVRLVVKQDDFFAYRGKFIRQIFEYVGYYCYLCSIIILIFKNINYE